MEKTPSFNDMIHTYKRTQGTDPLWLDFSTLDKKTLQKIVHINPNMQDANGMTTLDIASEIKYTEIVTQLLAHPNIKKQEYSS